jgi:hypothetical protein
MTDTTNAGPVLPEAPELLTTLRDSGRLTWRQAKEVDQSLRAEVENYGAQCFAACAEHVAGPLREALSECATAVGAGVSPDCSVEFLRKVPREVELVVAKLRERGAELERLVELYRVQGVERDNCAWLAMQAECEARGAELDRLRAENARLIEDRARFPDRPDDVGCMIGAHIGNLKAKAAAAEVAYHKVQLALHVSRAECEALTECLRECADDLEAEVKARGDLPRRVERDLEPVRRARELLAARAAREGK